MGRRIRAIHAGVSYKKRKIGRRFAEEEEHGECEAPVDHEGFTHNHFE